MGGPGQLVPAPVATAGVKPGESLESRKRKSKLGSPDWNEPQLCWNLQSLVPG